MAGEQVDLDELDEIATPPCAEWLGDTNWDEYNDLL